MPRFRAHLAKALPIDAGLVRFGLGLELGLGLGFGLGSGGNANPS